MVSELSIESYEKCHESRMIGRGQLEIVRYLIDRNNEPITQGEFNRSFGNSIKRYSPRFRELVIAGVIEQVGTTYDFITERNVGMYRLTGKIPVEPVRTKKKSKSCPHCGGTL